VANGLQLALKVDVAPEEIDPGEALKVQLGATGVVPPPLESNAP
jgi:hypothetical protein